MAEPITICDQVFLNGFSRRASSRWCCHPKLGRSTTRPAHSRRACVRDGKGSRAPHAHVPSTWRLWACRRHPHRSLGRSEEGMRRRRIVAKPHPLTLHLISFCGAPPSANHLSTAGRHVRQPALVGTHWLPALTFPVASFVPCSGRNANFFEFVVSIMLSLLGLRCPTRMGSLAIARRRELQASERKADGGL
jgi:hypothetical protein